MKNQKPIEYDISFKYTCQECEVSHWLFLREVQSKDFKVICECGNIFYTETVKNIEIVYCSDTEQLDIGSKAAKTIVALGYTKKQAYEMIQKSVVDNFFDNPNELVKYSLKNFGAEYV